MDDEEFRMYYALEYLVEKNLKQINDAFEEFHTFMNEKKEYEKENPEKR